MTTNKPTKLVVTQAQREAALEGRVHDCPYNHQIGTRCPNCASWPFKKGGAAAFIEQVRENHRLASTAPASDKIAYDEKAIDAVQKLLERGKATVDSDGYLVAYPPPASEDEVERVARALYECERNRSERTDVIISASAGKTVSVGMEPWEECWQVFHDDARAAIAALRPRSEREEIVRKTLEEAAKVAESFPFSDSAAIAHRIRALIDKEPSK